MGVGRKYFRRRFWSRYTLNLIHNIYFKIVLSLILGVFEHQKPSPYLRPFLLFIIELILIFYMKTHLEFTF